MKNRYLPFPVPSANTLLRNCLVIFTVLVALAAAMTGWCPVSCICNDQLVVHCSGQGLAEVPLDLPLATRQLLLSDNKITELPTVQLNYLSDLVYLDCSNNSLYHLCETTFINLKKLAYLDLSFNKLVQVDDRMFIALASLVVLRLTDNPGLDQMHVDAFAENSALQVLDISRNNLTLLNISTLITLPALRSIGVSGNPWECGCSNEDLCLWMQVEDYKFQGVPIQFEDDRLINTFGMCLLVRSVSCATPLQATHCTCCVLRATQTPSEVLHSTASFTLHWLCDCTAAVCRLRSTPLQAMRCSWLCDSPDTDTQPSALVLCPLYLVLGALAPQCVGLNAHGTLGTSVLRRPDALKPRCHRCSSASLHRWLRASVLHSLSVSASLVPRELHAFRTLCSGAFGATLPQSLGTSVLQHLQCLEDSMPRRLKGF
ncbi:UNVERIFIED_CONTAM: hypothetical protein FKN15_073029 [Acipenser sinensis]